MRHVSQIQQWENTDRSNRNRVNSRGWYVAIEERRLSDMGNWEFLPNAGAVGSSSKNSHGENRATIIRRLYSYPIVGIREQ